MSEKSTYAVCPEDGQPCTPQRAATREDGSCPTWDFVREAVALLMAEHRETNAEMAGR